MKKPRAARGGGDAGPVQFRLRRDAALLNNKRVNLTLRAVNAEICGISFMLSIKKTDAEKPAHEIGIANFLADSQSHERLWAQSQCSHTRHTKGLTPCDI
ncbi:hypothetical protein [Paracoccus laeviglucosivorans]|uniref:Uncharacterized protein n=1 Tax=Paracoccus laeviglucosivorans TaxID=1197861 RepID=A0A521DX49_9RHOB|nr:hypothetical protein [Paracoccus laeviglucosivorans]SMO75671.1 hypothetical protein SAMN06265221_11010 [Paracoccus laeviglucosivorans]